MHGSVAQIKSANEGEQGDHPGSTEEIAAAAAVFNLVNWQKDLVKQNMRNPEDAVKRSTKDQQKEEFPKKD